MSEANKGLTWFSGDFLIAVSRKNDSCRVVLDMQEEIAARQHLRNGSAIWDTQKGKILVRVDYEGLSKDQASDQMIEELYEIASAILESIEGMRIEKADTDFN